MSTTRKLIVTNIISVDGAFTGQGGEMMAMPFAAGFSEYNAERLRTASTLLLGRASFEMFRDHWPPIADDASQPEVEREISRRNNAIQKLVVSDTLTENDLGAWADTEIVRRADAGARVSALKADAGQDILIFGSHVLWNALLSAGLVDELHLMIGPGVVGTGIGAFSEAGPTRLRLLEARTLPEGQLALVRFAAA